MIEASGIDHIGLQRQGFVARGDYASLKAELEGHGIAVSGRPGDAHCIYFADPDGHRLQLIFRK